MKNNFENRPETEKPPVSEEEVLEFIHERVDVDKLTKELGSVFGQLREEDENKVREQLQSLLGDKYSKKKIEKSIPATQRRNELDNERRARDIKDTMEALGKIVIELKEKIHEYDAILSDDSSGRLLSLILRETFKEEGEAGIPTHFILGGGYLNSEEKIKNLKEYIKEKDLGKVLVVTEYIESGVSLNHLTSILKELDIDFDIVTLTTGKPISDEAYSEFSKNLIVGKEQYRTGLLFHRQPGYSGVDKQRKDPRSQEEPPPYPAKYINYYPEPVKEARKDVGLISRELSKLIQ